MTVIPVLNKDEVPSHGGHACFSNESLPIYYMSDHSVLGLLVEKYKEVVRILEGKKFDMNPIPGGVEVFVQNATGMKQIFGTLEEHGIDFEISDIFNRVYQG